MCRYCININKDDLFSSDQNFQLEFKTFTERRQINLLYFNISNRTLHFK